MEQRLEAVRSCEQSPRVQFKADPRFVAGALRRDQSSVSEWATEFAGRPAIIVDQTGGASGGSVAVQLRQAGASAADVPSGGHVASVEAGASNFRELARAADIAL
jgi:hypothetical protein